MCQNDMIYSMKCASETQHDLSHMMSFPMSAFLMMWPVRYKKARFSVENGHRFLT